MVIRLGNGDEEVAEDQVMVKSTGCWIYKKGKSTGYPSCGPRTDECAGQIPPKRFYMLHKILITFIVLAASITVALTLDIFDTPTVEAEKTGGIAEISTKPSIVALATRYEKFSAHR